MKFETSGRLPTRQASTCRRRFATTAAARWSASLLLVLLVSGGAITQPVAQAMAQAVAFQPSESLPTEPQFTVDLTIDCGGQQVMGAEVKVAFDPFLVQLDAVTAGGWYTGSGQPFYFFDYTGTDPPGVIHFASSVLGGSLTGSGVIAVCHFSIVDFGISPLIFQDVDVRSPVNVDLGFGHSVGDRIILDPVVTTETKTFGAIKAVYR